MSAADTHTRAKKVSTKRSAHEKGRSACSFPLLIYSAPGGLRQDPGHPAESLAEARTDEIGGSEMRVLLSTWGSRGDVEPLVALAMQLRELGAEVRLCAPPDFAERVADVGVAMVPLGRSVRELVHGAKPSTPADAPRVAADLVAAQFDTVPAAAEDCDALVATGLMPAAERTIAETLGIPYMLVTLHSARAAVAAPLAATAAGPTVPTGRDRQPGAVGRRRRAGADALRPAAQRAPGVDRPATGGRRPRPRLHRPPVAGARTRSWPRGVCRRTSTSCRPARGSCPTTAHSQPN